MSALQELGEASNRTFFLSGSNGLSEDTIALINLDKQEWNKVSNEASAKIQKAWRGFNFRKESAEVYNSDGDVDLITGGLEKSSLDDIISISPSILPKAKETKKLSGDVIEKNK